MLAVTTKMDLRYAQSSLLKIGFTANLCFQANTSECNTEHSTVRLQASFKVPLSKKKASVLSTYFTSLQSQRRSVDAST